MTTYMINGRYASAEEYAEVAAPLLLKLQAENAALREAAGRALALAGRAERRGGPIMAHALRDALALPDEVDQPE